MKKTNQKDTRKVKPDDMFGDKAKKEAPVEDMPPAPAPQLEPEVVTPRDEGHSLNSRATNATAPRKM